MHIIGYIGGHSIQPCNMKLDHVVRMSVSGYIVLRFEPRQHQYVVSLSKILYPHCFSLLSCEMNTR